MFQSITTPVIVARCTDCGSTVEAPESDSATFYVNAHNKGEMDIACCSPKTTIVGMGV